MNSATQADRSMPLEGGCLCGAVRYQISGAIPAAGHCHCSICRRFHGAAYVTWALIEAAQFRWTAGEDSVAGYESSPGMQRLFCRHCSSPLAASQEDKVNEVVFASLQGDPGVRPSEHIFVGSKATWHEITDNLPRHEAWPPGR